MINARNRAARRHNRQLKIAATGKYLARVLPGATDRQVRIRAKHPACDCPMCCKDAQLERHLFNLREDRRVERILKEQLYDGVRMCTDGTFLWIEEHEL